MAGFRWMLMVVSLAAASGCAGVELAQPAPRRTAATGLPVTSTAMTVRTSTPISAAEATGSATGFDPAYPPPPTVPPAQSPYPSNWTSPPAATAVPVAITDTLPLDWGWFYESGYESRYATCGRALYARHGDQFARLADDLLAFLPRQGQTPLLITCHGDFEYSVNLVDFAAGMVLPLETDPDHHFNYAQALLSPDGAEIAFDVHPREATFAPMGFKGVYVIEVASGAMSPLFEFPPPEEGQVYWDSYSLLAWRPEGFTYGSRSSGQTATWAATWPEGAERPYTVRDGTLSVTELETAPPQSGAGVVDETIPAWFDEPRVIWQP